MHFDDSDRIARRWRIWAFWGTWLAYAGYYLCRKTLTNAQPEIMKEFGWTAQVMGIMITGYHIGYASGQFVNGALCDKWRAKSVMIIGLLATIILNVLFGFSSSIFIMSLLWTLNGYAQSAGWPSVIKGMSNWFSLHERGKVMAPWGSCYTIGDVAATALAAFIIGHTAKHTIVNPVGQTVTYAEWQWVFWICAMVLALITVIVFIIFKDKPEDVGLQIHQEQRLTQGPTPAEAPVSIMDNVREIIGQGPVWVLAMSYFGIKFIRYTFMFWSVTFLTMERGMATDTAGYYSTLFAFVGLFGTMVASYLSDKVFASRRAPICAIMLLGLMVSLFFFNKAPNSLIPVAMGLVGFMTYGPDFVISAVAVMDFGSRKRAATTAGFVNGMGSIGQIFSGWLVGWIVGNMGWQAVFYFMIFIALACSLLIASLWNKVGEH
jgi:MFS transporter, OPA family, sugar phosphate sensor protein UhpC